MRALSKLGAFVRRHKQTEETVGTAIGLDVLWQILVGAGLFGAGIATAAVLASSPAPNPNAHLALSLKGAAFITRNEGVRYHPYQDPSGIAACTVGVGHVLGFYYCTPAQMRETYTPAQVTALLMHDVSWAETCVRSLTHRLDQGQFDALVDLTFNAGCGALDYSGLRRLVDAGNYAAVPSTLRRTAVTAGGVYLQGLANRRAAEATLWSTHYYGAGIGYVLPPKPPTAADRLRGRTGYWSWLDWYLGEGPWKKYRPHVGKVRPHVPARVPSSWWRRERAFVRARR